MSRWQLSSPVKVLQTVQNLGHGNATASFLYIHVYSRNMWELSAPWSFSKMNNAIGEPCALYAASNIAILSCLNERRASNSLVHIAFLFPYSVQNLGDYDTVCTFIKHLYYNGELASGDLRDEAITCLRDSCRSTHSIGWCLDGVIHVCGLSSIEHNFLTWLS